MAMNKFLKCRHECLQRCLSKSCARPQLHRTPDAPICELTPAGNIPRDAGKIPRAEGRSHRFHPLGVQNGTTATIAPGHNTCSEACSNLSGRFECDAQL